MFPALAKLTARFRVLVVILWVAIGVIFLLFAPSLSEVGVTNETGLTSVNTESAHAARLLEEKFPAASSDSEGSAFIVVYNPDRLSAADTEAARRVRDWLLSPQAPPVIDNVVSVFDQEALRPVLTSQDGTAMLINFELAIDPTTEAAMTAIDDVRANMHSIAGSTAMYVTGNAGLAADLLTSIEDTVNTTTLVTVILVIVLLLLIYRSPVAIFVPLITISMSFLVARGILGYMAAAGVEISALLEAYLVVTIFGVGTDYCLFMVSRFKEELAGHDRREAGRLAFRRIAPVIAASAITVVIAFLCLGVSSFPTTRTIGFALAIGVATTLIAGLTLTPALISLFGDKLFWPLKTSRPQPANEKKLSWRYIGKQVTQRPVPFIVAIVVVLALPYIQLARFSTSADVFSQMPQNTESTQGIEVLREHFPSGEFSPYHVLLQSDNLTSPAGLDGVRSAAASLGAIDGVSKVIYFSAPTGILGNWSTTIQGIISNPTTGLTKLGSLQELGNELLSMAVTYPGVAQSQNFTGAGTQLAKVASLAGQITSTADAIRLFPDISAALSALKGNLDGLSAEFNLQAASPFSAWLKTTYFSQDGTTARIEVVPKADPYSRENLDLAKRLRVAMPGVLSSANLGSASSLVGGEGARQLDVINTSDSDFQRVMILASLSIFIVVVLLLRSLLAPLYMVATVLFNFGATLGISAWLFLTVLKQQNVIYLLPIFVFVLLVAVGADYNIFLVSRIKEEAEGKPIRAAVREAVAHTGGIITACGIILAGTFAALISAPLQLVFQIGAAIALGIIIDTFLVRALLVPSLVAVAGRWSWWPSRGSAASRKD